MKLTARLALSQIRVNKRRTIWTCLGIILSTAMLTTIYGLGFATGMGWVNQMTMDSGFRYNYLAFISGLAFVMSVFVISISIIVISNAFRVSANERMAQFGILKSTGATKSQIMQIVVYEGLFLTAIGIPIGIIIGLLVHFISVDMINNVISPMLSIEERASGEYMMEFVFSWFSLGLSLAVSLLTVFLSAWFPARKASRISAINAIRQSGEVVIKNKKVRGKGVVQKLFKTEGALAQIFLKRSKKNFRATVIAMSFSVAIFIIAGSFYTQMIHFTEVQWAQSGGNASFNVTLRDVVQIDCDEFDEGEGHWSQGGYLENSSSQDEFLDIERTCFARLDWEDVVRPMSDFTDLHESLMGILNEGDTLVGFAGGGWLNHSFTYLYESELTREFVSVREEMVWFPQEGLHELDVELIVVDDEFAAYLADLAGVLPGSNILLNYGRDWFTDGRVAEFEVLDFNYQTLDLVTWEWDEESGERISNATTIELHGQITPANRPTQLLPHGIWGVQVVVPSSSIDAMNMNWIIQTDESARVVTEGEELIFDFFEGYEVDVWAVDIDAGEALTRNTVGLVMFFIFAFVAVLILIGLTNIISTISENVKTRSKEFAVLQSVGMTGGGIGRMLNLESIFSSIRALIFGVPLGILGSYGLHHAMSNMIYINFSIPWFWLVTAVISVFIITWGTMRYAAGRLKKQNIIETIRSGSGM